MTRRSAIAAVGLSMASACTWRHRRPAAAMPSTPVDPDVAARAAAVQREQTLVTGYDHALLVAPSLAPRLAPLRADHVAHLAALGSSPGPAAAAAPVAQVPAAVLRQLRSLEHSAADSHAAAAVTSSRRLAPLLASLAACEASHGVAL